MFKLIKFLIIILIAGFGFLFLNLNPILKEGIVRTGSYVLQVPVDLEESNVSLMGSGELKGLKVSNPEGFKSEHLFHLGRVKLNIDLLSLTSDTIHIKEVIVDTPHIIYEGGLNKSNIKALINNLSSESSEKEPDAKTSEEEPTEKSDKKIIIDHILLKDTKVGYSNALLNGKTINLKIPTFEKHNIGKDQGGLPPEEILRGILVDIQKSILKGIEKSGVQIGNALQQIDDNLKDSAVKDEINKAADKLKGLFGK